MTESTRLMDREGAAECWMRFRVYFRRATTTALVASGAPNSAAPERAGALAPAPWYWFGGYIDGHGGGDDGQHSFSNPYVSLRYGCVVPMFPAGSQIGYNRQRHS